MVVIKLRQNDNTIHICILIIHYNFHIRVLLEKFKITKVNMNMLKLSF